MADSSRRANFAETPLVVCCNVVSGVDVEVLVVVVVVILRVVVGGVTN